MILSPIFSVVHLYYGLNIPIYSAGFHYCKNLMLFPNTNGQSMIQFKLFDKCCEMGYMKSQDWDPLKM